MALYCPICGRQFFTKYAALPSHQGFAMTCSGSGMPPLSQLQFDEQVAKWAEERRKRREKTSMHVAGDSQDNSPRSGLHKAVKEEL